MTEEHEQKADEYAEKHAFRVPYDGLNKFYEICKFIVCLCGTVLMVLFTIVSLYITFK